MKYFNGLISLIIACASSNALTLDDVMRQTVEHNPEIQQARLRLEQAMGKKLELRSVAYPDAVIGAVLGDQGGHRSGDNSNQPFAFPYGGITQPLFNAAIPASFRRSNLEVLIAQQELNIAITNQLHGARLSFYTAIYNRDLKKIRSEQFQRLKANIDSQAQRYQTGLVSRSVSVGAEVQASELQPQVEASDRAWQGAELRIVEAMGENLGPSATLPEPAGELKYSPINIDLPAEVSRTLQRRPDLELARLVARAAKEDERILEAAYYPELNANVAGEYIPTTKVRRLQSQGSPQRSNDFVSSEIRVGGAYTWRVIDNGRVYGTVKRQRSAREINELLLHKMEQDIPREMSRIDHNLKAIAEKQALLANASGAAAQNALTIQENLEKGIVSQLDYRQVENASLEIQSHLLDLAYQQKVALAEWDRATGRYFRYSESGRRAEALR
ncbi:MAG TPA: TolC family protein [Chthoniobacterales bacterium]|jgi:outer membrane protein TolC